MLSWIEIDVAAVGKNLEAFRSVVTRGTAVMAVVKANAYGHGIEVVAPVAARHADWLGVNSLEEALTVRELGSTNPSRFSGIPNWIIWSTSLPDSFARLSTGRMSRLRCQIMPGIEE
jgi:hypothetical protein